MKTCFRLVAKLGRIRKLGSRPFQIEKAQQLNHPNALSLCATAQVFWSCAMKWDAHFMAQGLNIPQNSVPL